MENSKEKCILILEVKMVNIVCYCNIAGQENSPPLQDTS